MYYINSIKEDLKGDFIVSYIQGKEPEHKELCSNVTIKKIEFGEWFYENDFWKDWKTLDGKRTLVWPFEQMLKDQCHYFFMRKYLVEYFKETPCTECEDLGRDCGDHYDHSDALRENLKF